MADASPGFREAVALFWRQRWFYVGLLLVIAGVAGVSYGVTAFFHEVFS